MTDNIHQFPDKTSIKELLAHLRKSSPDLFVCILVKGEELELVSNTDHEVVTDLLLEAIIANRYNQMTQGLH